jgi:CheY-like chemotaxis protein
MSAKPFHIVIADDDDDDQFIIKEAFSEYHGSQLQITSVYDGLQLIDLLKKKPPFNTNEFSTPDIILLDINMPVMNGFEALDLIKSDKNFSQIPVYIISTVRPSDKSDKCINLGASNFFSKPNRIGAYKPIIEEIFSNTLYTRDTVMEQ